MRTRPSAPVDAEQLATLHEIALSAELCCAGAEQLSQALDAYAGAARKFFQDYAAGREPDPVPLLVRFGAAHELLDQITNRFEVGADALTGLRFNLAPSAPKLASTPADDAADNVIRMRGVWTEIDEEEGE